MMKDEETVPVLRACVRDLAALTALPTLWVEREPEEVVGSFLDVLLSALGLDIAYADIEDPQRGKPIEAVRVRMNGGAIDTTVDLVRRSLGPELGASKRITIPDPLDSSERLHVTTLTLASGRGTVAALSRRSDFPTALESVTLEAALNQLMLWHRLAEVRVEARRAEAALAERESSRLQLENENAYLREEVEVALAFGAIVGQSRALRDILTEVELVAPTDATVLILGESGTGKELLAREIHERSRRADRALIKVNCSAIPREMFESEFFGHVRGAFTGAVRDRPGRFKLAENGTIFLDEVGELPLDLQPKLLRVLQEGQYERVGDDATHSVDVRIIAATNRDLAADVSAGQFREDLYYRLSVFPIQIPPLRDRKEDITPLAAHFVALVSKRLGVQPLPISESQSTALKSYDWPGNVRELQNVVERAVILSRGTSLRIEQVLLGRTSEQRRSPVPPANPQEIVSDEEWRRRERENLIAALTRTQGRIYGTGGAAELLGIKPSTLQSRLRALGIRARARA